MEKYILSKSTFIRGTQCPKSLYLYKNFFNQRDKISAAQEAIFSRGTNVGVLARNIFPGGTDASPKSRLKFSESVLLTQKLIEQGCEIIYEAAFQFNRTLVAMDMIVKRGGAWYAYEVKSSTRITPTYILDAALQYYVICHSGLDLADISIVNVNTDYERQGKLNYNELFKISSVRNEVMQKQDFVRDNLQRLLDIAGDPNQPSVQIGQQCFSPYACDFMGTCWKAIPENSVLNLNGVAKGELFQLYNNGIKTLDEIPLSYPLNKQLKLQVECGLSNNVHIDREGLGKFMDTIHYPLYFMDFETIMPAVPVFDKTHPYQHIPFQFSIHFKETKNAEPVHVDFLAEAGTDPRRQFVEELIRQTSVPGDILTYNATFERSILIQLKKQFPAYADAIDYIIYRIKDLMFPFENKLYYHPLMKGSYSIKNVLPALAGGIDYENLRIGSGSVAMTAFENLQSETDLYKIAETRDALKAYCQLDTLAMVKILDVLEHSLANNSGINKGG